MPEDYLPPTAPKACRRCHALKKRCDRVYPLCLRCHMSKSQCIYSEAPRDSPSESVDSASIEQLQAQMDDLSSQLKDIKEQNTATAVNNPSSQSLVEQQPTTSQYNVKAGMDACDRWDIRINSDGIAIDTSAFTIADLMKGMQHSAQLLGIDKSLALDTLTESQRQNALRWRTQDETIAKSFLNVYSEVQDTLDTHPSAVTSSDSSNHVMICLHNFFICFYPWAPCFHKPTFMAKLADTAGHTSSFKLLILAICAYNASHALGFHEAEYPWNCVNDMTRSGQSFYVAARKILPDIILDDAPDVWTIVALHYLSVFCLDKSKSRSLHYHSLAVRMAIQQGYNSRDRNCSDATDVEIGRRLWWTLMLFQDILDWTGYTDGELKALRETNIDFPAPLPDEEEPTAEALGFYVHFIQNIMKHNGMHQGFIEKQKKFCFGQSPQSPISDGKSLSPLSPELDFVDMEWRGHLPESTRNTMNCALQVVQQFTELTFHKRRILEAQLKADTQVLKQSMDDCISTANALVHTFEDCYGNQLTHFNNVLELWHASIMSVVCAVLLNSADEGQQSASEQRQHLERLLQIFKDISFSRTSELNLDRIRDHNPAWDKFNSVLIAQGIVKQISIHSPRDVSMATNDAGGQSFNPSLWRQRRAFVLEILREHAVTSVMDYGCGEGTLLSVLTQASCVDSITQLIGLDLSNTALGICAKACEPWQVDYDNLRESPLDIYLYQGDATVPDKRLAGFDAIVCSEVIEHLQPHQVRVVLPILLGDYQPKLLVVTTPNIEYNINFPALKYDTPEQQLRNDDHKFEWTRHDFETWCRNGAQTYGYTAEFHGIGKMDHPVVYKDVGHCTQACVFTRSPIAQPRTNLSQTPHVLLKHIIFPWYNFPDKPEDEAIEELSDIISAMTLVSISPEALSPAPLNWCETWSWDQVTDSPSPTVLSNEEPRTALVHCDVSFEDVWNVLRVRQLCRTRARLRDFLEKLPQAHIINNEK